MVDNLTSIKKKYKPISDKKYSVGEKLISNLTYLFFDWAILSLFSFLFWFILGKILSPSELGIISTSLNLIIFTTGFSALGINVALSKLIPEMKEKNGLDDVFSFVKLSLKPIFFSLTLLLLFFLVFSSYLSVFIKMPYNLFLITAFSCVIVSLFYLFGSILYGLQNMKLLFFTDFFLGLLKVVLPILFIFLNFSYFGVVLGFTFSHFITLIPRLNSKYFKSMTKGSYQKLFSFAIPAVIYGLSYTLIANGSYIILTILKTPEVTGLFTIAFTITSTIGILIHLPNTALFPIISGLSVDSKFKTKKCYLIGLVLRYSLFIIIPVAILLFIFSSQVVVLFSSSKFLPSTKYFPILIPAVMLYGFGTICSTNLYAIGKPKIYRNIMVISSLIFLISSLILTNYYSATGLSLSYLMTMMVYFLLNFIFLRKHLQITFFIKDFLKVLVSTFIIATILIFVESSVHNFFTIFILMIPIGLFYLILLFLMKFYRKEDVMILKFFGRNFPIIKKYVLLIVRLIEKRIV